MAGRRNQLVQRVVADALVAERNLLGTGESSQAFKVSRWDRDLGSRFGFDPLASLELESYFLTVLSEADKAGIREGDLRDWLLRRIAPEFRSVADKPRWIQGEDWQISEGRPIVFIGQIDIAPTPGLATHEARHLHRGASDQGRARGGSRRADGGGGLRGRGGRCRRRGSGGVAHPAARSRADAPASSQSPPQPALHR